MAQVQRHVTRFIGLADVGNPEKKKWIYAFNIVPMKHLQKSDLVAQPPIVTEMPFNESHIKVSVVNPTSYQKRNIHANVLLSFREQSKSLHNFSMT